MLQDSRLQSIFEVLKVIPREFGIDPLVHELELDEGKKTLISLGSTLHRRDSAETGRLCNVIVYASF